MNNATGESLVVFCDSFDVWDPGDVVMAGSDDQRIEPFLPPLILAGKLLSQSENPLVALLFSKLYSCVELKQLLVSVSYENVLNPFSNLLPTAEGGVIAIFLPNAIRQAFWERFRCEAHNLRCDISVKVLMLGGI